MFNAVQASLHTHTQLRYLSLLFPLSRGGSSPSLFLRSWLHLFACGWNSCCRGWGFWVHSTGALLPVMLILGTAATLHAEKLQQNFIAGPLLVSLVIKSYTLECVENVFFSPLGGCDTLHNENQSALFPHWKKARQFPKYNPWDTVSQLTDYFTRIISPADRPLARPTRNLSL